MIGFAYGFSDEFFVGLEWLGLEQLGLFATWQLDPFAITGEYTNCTCGKPIYYIAGMYVFDTDPVAFAIGGGYGSNHGNLPCSRSMASMALGDFSLYGNVGYWTGIEEIIVDLGLAFTF